MKHSVLGKHFARQWLWMSIVAVGCSTGTTQRMDLDAEVVGDPDSILTQDYRTVADQMARDILLIPQIGNASSPPTIMFSTVENRSTIYLDKKAFLEKIRTHLIRNSAGKLVFLDRDKIAEIESENRLKELGRRTSSGREKHGVYGADFILTGVISSVNRAAGARKTQYLRYSFRLVDAATSAIIWENDYESKFKSSKALYDR